MTASDFHGKPVVPDSVKHLDADVLVEVLSRHAINVSEAAAELGSGAPIFDVCFGLGRS